MIPKLRLVDPLPAPVGPRSHSWMERANCIGKTDMFFDPTTEAEVEAARAICTACPVRRACLRLAMTESIDHGMWGGYTEHERRRIRRNKPPIVMKPPKGRPPAKHTTGERILELLAERPMTATELQDRLGYKQNTIAHWTGVLRREGSITYSRLPGRHAWLYQLCGGGPST